MAATDWRASVLAGLDAARERRRLTGLGRLRRWPAATLLNSARMRAANLALRLRGKPLTPVVSTIFGARMRVAVPPHGDMWLYGADVDSDAEARLTRYLVRELKPGAVFYDLGASIGYYTLLASRLVGPDGRVHAFEASPAALPLLRENAAGAANVRVVEKAVGDESGTASFYVAPFPFIGTSSLRPDWIRLPTTRVDVQAVRLDDYCRAEEAPSFVKIDVEGCEDRALAGAGRLLTERRPDLALEVLFPLADAHRRALRRLEELGYAPFAIDEAGALRRLDYAGLDAYFAELKSRYAVIQDSPNDFDNLIFRAGGR